MFDMAVVNDNSESYVLIDESIKNNMESSDTSVLPSGESVNNLSVLKSSGNENMDTEPYERRKKTRRGKSKRKNPYNKEGNERRKAAANRQKYRPRFAHRHADAPYNTNEFLMEDHNTFVSIHSPPTTQANSINSRPVRVRDPSFTSVDSDEDYFYSSPEDEEDFLTKEFSNTYRDLHVETLQGLTKSELIQHVLQLEEKVDIFEKRAGTKFDKEESEDLINTVDCFPEDVGKISVSLEKLKQFQLEITRLRLENEKLQIENKKLQRRTRSSSVSSVDSESDSSSSSPSSSELSDKEELLRSNENEESEHSRETVDSVSAKSKNSEALEDNITTGY